MELETKNNSGLTQFREKFLKLFPKGFKDRKYLSWERNYKWQAHISWENELNEKEYRRLLAENNYEEIAWRAVMVEAKTNLLLPFEKVALKDAVKEKNAAKLFAEGLFHYIYDQKPLKERFEQFAVAVSSLPLKQAKTLTWPLQTVFGFIANPKEHMFLKPRITQQAAEAYSFDLNYSSQPNWNTYKSLFAFARRIYRDIADLKPADLIDVQSFIAVVGSKEDDFK